jgi:hypothetical protein
MKSMVKIAGVPIPERMHHRGYPIHVRRYEALCENLCPICGMNLLRGQWFVGGPMSAFLP